MRFSSRIFSSSLLTGLRRGVTPRGAVLFLGSRLSQAERSRLWTSASIMPPPMATAQGLRLYIANIGGQPAGHEGQLIAQVRGRFNLKYERAESLKHLTDAYVYSVDPIVDYLRNSLGDAKCRGLPRMDFAIHLHELYRIAVSRTRIGRRYIEVTDNAEAWSNVGASLQLRLAGTFPTRPALKTAPSEDTPNWEPSLAARPP